jgi:hypothetical protein
MHAPKCHKSEIEPEMEKNERTYRSNNLPKAFMAVLPGQSWKRVFARAPLSYKYVSMICMLCTFKLGSALMEGENFLSPFRVAVAGCGVYREPQSGGTQGRAL